jgi:hypothetical protein
VLVARRACVVAFEFKECITQRKDNMKLSLTAVNDAVNRIQRDFVNTLPRSVPPNLPVGFGVIGDGRVMILTRIQIDNRGVKTFLSDLYDLTDIANRKSFFVDFVRMLGVAASRRWMHPTGVAVDTGELGGALVDVIAVRQHAVVYRWRSPDSLTFVHKYIANVARRNLEFDIWLGANEHALQGNLGPGVVRPRSFDRASRTLCYIDDGWQSLDGRITCRHAAPDMTFLRAMVMQVGDALRYLHAKKHAFVDVHPGNIMVSSDSLRFKLIDAEQVRPFDDANESRTAKERGLKQRAHFWPREINKRPINAITDADAESLALVIAWVLNNDYAFVAAPTDAMKTNVLKSLLGHQLAVEFDLLGFISIETLVTLFAIDDDSRGEIDGSG